MGSVVEEGLELWWGEVRDADVEGFATAHELGHGGPSIEEFDFVMSQGGVGDGPVHVVEVEVGELEVGEGGGEAGGDVFGAVADGVVSQVYYERMRMGGFTGRSRAYW